MLIRWCVSCPWCWNGACLHCVAVYQPCAAGVGSGFLYYFLIPTCTLYTYIHFHTTVRFFSHLLFIILFCGLVVWSSVFTSQTCVMWDGFVSLCVMMAKEVIPRFRVPFRKSVAHGQGGGCWHFNLPMFFSVHFPIVFLFLHFVGDAHS